MQLQVWAHRQFTYAQLSPLYLLYITHMIIYSRSSTAFLYCKQWKAEQGMGTRLA